MRIEYAITFIDGKPQMSHRVTTDGVDSGGGAGGTGGDPGGGAGGTGGDPGGGPGGTGGDPGGGAGGTGGDPGGASAGNCCGQSIVVMGPTVVACCGCGTSSGGLSFTRRRIPATHVIPGSKPPILTPGTERLVGSPIQLQFQEQTYWCWAAVGSSVHTFFKAVPTLSQCQVGNAVAEMQRLIDPQSTPAVDLCANPQAGNNQKSLKLTLGTLGNLKNADLGGIADFARIQEEIAADRPLGCRIAWDTYGDGYEEGAHFVIVAGWKVDAAGNKMVQVLDPDGGTVGIHGAATPRDVVYEQFRDAYEGTGKWMASYFVKAVA